MKKVLLFLCTLCATSLMAQSSKKDQLVKITTPFGDMIVVLYDETPLHKANFLDLAESGRYDSTIFHRVIEDFMIQGGDIFRKPDEQQGQDDDRLPAEIIDGLFHHKGALAAARTNNPEKKSSSCQFYIVDGRVSSETSLMYDQGKLNRVFAEMLQGGQIDSLRNILVEMQRDGRIAEMNEFIANSAPYLEEVSGQSLVSELSPEVVEAYSTVGGVPHLDGEYTVFGRVISGLDIIDQIAAVETAPGDMPVEDVFMTMEVFEMKKKKIEKEYGYAYE